jgi:hypothetical protein
MFGGLSGETLEAEGGLTEDSVNAQGRLAEHSLLERKGREEEWKQERKGALRGETERRESEDAVDGRGRGDVRQNVPGRSDDGRELRPPSNADVSRGGAGLEVRGDRTTSGAMGFAEVTTFAKTCLRNDPGGRRSGVRKSRSEAEPKRSADGPAVAGQTAPWANRSVAESQRSVDRRSQMASHDSIQNPGGHVGGATFAVARHPGACVSRTHGVDVRGFGCWWAHRSRVLTNAATWAFLIGRRFPTNIAPSSALLLAPPDTFLRTWLLLPGAPALASRETCATTPHRFSSQHVLTNVADSPGPRFFASRSRDVLANAATTPAAFHSSLCRAALAASAAIPADSSSPLSTSELSRR